MDLKAKPAGSVLSAGLPLHLEREASLVLYVCKLKQNLETPMPGICRLLIDLYAQGSRSQSLQAMQLIDPDTLHVLGTRNKRK